MLASTFYDPVLGIDTHIVLVPAPPSPSPIPTPVPLPFVGLVFDPLGLLVGAGIGMALGGGPGIVLINSLPATNCGTEVTNLMTCPHLPAPGVAFATGLPGNDAQLYFGALDVSLAGTLAVRFGEAALSCGDPIRLPTSVVMAVPKGCPVVILRPPVPDLMAIAMAIAMRVGMAALRGLVRRGARLMRALRRMQRASPRWRAIAQRLHRYVDNIVPRRLRSRIHRAVCHLTGHPVDVVTGRVLTEAVDFELPGPIPLKLERVYDSSMSWRRGPLGYGWSHSLDQAVWRERGKVVYRAEDGREIEFHTHDLPGRTLRSGGEMYHPFERLWLRCLEDGRWEIRDRSWRIHEFVPVQGDTSGHSRLVGIRDNNGHRVDLTYDRQGWLETIRDSGGRLIRLESDRQGRLRELKLPTSRGDGWYVHRRFDYDELDNLTEVEDSCGERWRFEYVSHLLTRETDRTGVSFYFQYDGHGSGARCTRTWGDGGIYDHVLSYDTASQKTIVEDSLGGVRLYEFDALGHVVAMTDATGGRTEFEYDLDVDRLALERSPLGQETSYAYDAMGNTVCVVAPDGATTKIAWDQSYSLPTRVEDAHGAVWRFAYDHNGNLVRHEMPDGQHTDYEWSEGRVAVIHDLPGGATRLSYDRHQNIEAIELPNGTETRYWWNAKGRLIKSRSATGATSHVEYDSEDRPVRFIAPNGLADERILDAEGYPLEVRETGRATRYEYGNFHRILASVEAGARREYAYDTEGRLVSFTNEVGGVFSVELDRAGRVTAETDFDGGRRQFVLDGDGRVVLTTSPSGRTSAFEYDVCGRLLTAEHSDGGRVTFAYDSVGRVVRGTNESADVRIERDVLGRVVAESQDGGRTWVRSTYGANGRRELTSDLGARQEAEYDSLGLVARLTHGGALGEPRRDVAIWRDNAGRETARSLPGALSVQWAYDAVGRPVQRHTLREVPKSAVEPALPSASVDARGFAWDGWERLVSVVDAERGPTRFEHDAMGGVVRSRSPRSEVVRQLDGAGSVINCGMGQRTVTAGGRVREAEGFAYVYDDDGNQASRVEPGGARWSYAWSGEGLLKSVKRPDGRIVRFEYDAFRRRVAKSIVSSDGEVSARVESEVRFVWDGNDILHEVTPNEPAVTWYREPSSGALVGRQQGSHWRSVVTDQIGAPTELYDELGELAWQMQLTIFGVAEVTLGEAVECPWRWSGQYEDPEVGLSYNHHRYYDPRLGHFVSDDPLSLLGGPSLTGYPRDPLTHADPLGLVTEALMKAMRADGRPVKGGMTAHHIVQRNGGHWANMSEEILQRHNPMWTRDHASNGARMWGTHPTQQAVPGHPGRGVSGSRPPGYHAGTHLHGPRAQQRVYEVLARAERLGMDPERVLRQIGERQETGRWRC